MKDKIFSFDLKYNNVAASFVIKTIEEIDAALGGIADEPHKHNYYTVIWPFDASGKHVIDFKDYEIVPHHLFFVSPGQVHQVVANPSPKGVVILFTTEFLQRNSISPDFISNLKIFQNSDETPPLPLNEGMQQMLKVFSDAMFQAFGSDEEMKYETLGAYLKLFLIACNGHCSLFPGSNTQTIEVERSVVKRFKEIVEIHFRQWHQVQEFADVLHVSPNYLNEVIKQSINKSAKAYIQDRIVLEAKRLSVYTSSSSKEIGYELGFDDPAHFSKFFKSQTGITFADFKLQLNNAIK